jgi:hypothetical protein
MMITKTAKMTIWRTKVMSKSSVTPPSLDMPAKRRPVESVAERR